MRLTVYHRKETKTAPNDKHHQHYYMMEDDCEDMEETENDEKGQHKEKQNPSKPLHNHHIQYLVCPYMYK